MWVPLHLMWYLVFVSEEQCIHWDRLVAFPITPHQPQLPRCWWDNLSTATFTLHRCLCVWVCASLQWHLPRCDRVQRHHCKGEHTPSWRTAVCPSPLHMVAQLHSHFHTKTHKTRTTHTQTPIECLITLKYHGRLEGERCTGAIEGWRGVKEWKAEKQTMTERGSRVKGGLMEERSWLIPVPEPSYLQKSVHYWLPCGWRWSYHSLWHCQNSHITHWEGPWKTKKSEAIFLAYFIITAHTYRQTHKLLSFSLQTFHWGPALMCTVVLRSQRMVRSWLEKWMTV